MADDIQYPQDTYSGGSVVMQGISPEGDRWVYDNDKTKWVNLKTGESSTRPPPSFEPGGNAAENTHALAENMRELDRQINNGTFKPTPFTPAQRATIEPESNARWAAAADTHNGIRAWSTQPPFPGSGFVPPYMQEQPAIVAPTKPTPAPANNSSESDAPQPSPEEQANAAKTLTDQMRREESDLMPPSPESSPDVQRTWSNLQLSKQALERSAGPLQNDIASGKAYSGPVSVTPPQSPGVQQPIAPPQIDPAYRQRLMEQRSVPSTRTPPSPASIQSYNLQMYQRAVAQGMPQKQAAQIYLGPMLAAQGQAKPTPVPPHRDVAGVLYERNPTTGEWEAKTKPKIAPVKPEPRDPELQAELNDVRKRMFEVDKSVAKGDLTKEEGDDLTKKYQDQLDELKDKYYKRPTNTPQRTFGRGIGVLKPEGASAPSAASSAPIAPNNGGDVKAQALAAIKKGADANAVKARYKKLTGQDLE